jgi:hypothetical protein
LRTQLIRIQQNNFRHSTLAQAEQSGLSNRNINSDLSTTVATPQTNTITTYVSRRGEQNVPKQYIKEAEWLDKEYSWGYYTTSNNSTDDNTFIAVDFDFRALQWGVTRKLPDNGGFAIKQPAPVKLGLRIYNEERVDRSCWGPLDRQEDKEEEQPHNEFKFGSDQEDTPDENINIPVTDAAAAVEEQLAQLASDIPTDISPAKFIPTSVYKASTPASTMASIAATTTIPPATILGRTTRFAVPSNPFGSRPPSSGPPGGGGGGHWSSRGPPMGGGPPGPPGGGGNPGGHGGGGNPGGGKLVGCEPEVFNGTQSKTEGFLQEWNIYYGLNWGADVITMPFTRTMLFLSFIKGPNIQEWVAAQIEWLGDQLAGGAQVHNKYLWRTIINRFKDAFTDTMSVEKAE